MNEKSEGKMGIKNKVQILLFPVTLAAGIITGIAIERTKKKAAGIAARRFRRKRMKKIRRKTLKLNNVRRECPENSRKFDFGYRYFDTCIF